MILKHQAWTFDLPIRSGLCRLIIEHPTLFQRVVLDLEAQSEGADGGFFLIHKDEEVPFEKHAYWLHSPLALDLNDRKILGALYKRLEAEITQTALLELKALQQQLSTFVEDAILQESLALEHNAEPSVTDLLKLMKVRFAPPADLTLGERLGEYIKIINQYLKPSLMICLQGSAYFTPAEYEALQETCAMAGLCLILLENHQPSPSCGDMQNYIVDRDYCEIY